MKGPQPREDGGGGKAPRACIMGTGDELVAGTTVDTNSSFIARRLTEHGYHIVRMAAVGDDPDVLRAELLRTADECRLIVVTGGLGPTADDRTRQAVASAAGVALEPDEGSLEHVRRIVEGYGRRMSEAHAVQALFPVGSRVFPNTCGTACGFACEVGRARVIVMPGVPAEMEAMFTGSVLPWLLSELHGSVALRQVNTCGMPESEVDERLTGLVELGQNPSVGLKATGGGVSVCIRARAETIEEARALAESHCRTVEERLGQAVYGRDGATLAAALARLLAERQMKVAVAESCTGGLIGSMLTDEPGISKVFLLDVVAYDDRAKTALLGVPAGEIRARGAVSPEVAGLMAQGVCRASGAELGISTTGIAGPTGGTDEKPVGLVYVGLCTAGRTRVEELKLRGSRTSIKDRAAKYALNLARLELLKQG